MKFRKSMLAVLCVASMGAATLPTIATAAVDVYFNTAPPAQRHEVVPAPRAGYLWVPGYWDAHGTRHVWRAGHWERERHGYLYHEPRWVQHDDRWMLERGRWVRDSDRDGAPDYRDRAPNNPLRN